MAAANLVGNFYTLTREKDEDCVRVFVDTDHSVVFRSSGVVKGHCNVRGDFTIRLSLDGTYELINPMGPNSLPDGTFLCVATEDDGTADVRFYQDGTYGSVYLAGDYVIEAGANRIPVRFDSLQCEFSIIEDFSGVYSFEDANGTYTAIVEMDNVHIDARDFDRFSANYRLTACEQDHHVGRVLLHPDSGDLWFCLWLDDPHYGAPSFRLVPFEK
jgi:hypothetical protein